MCSCFINMGETQIHSIYNVQNILYFLLTASLSIVFLISYLNKTKRYRNFYKLNGPKAYPIIGNAYLFFKAKTTKEVLDVVINLMRTYGLPMRCSFGTNLYYLTIDPKEIKYLLSHSEALEKGYVYKFFENYFKKGLLTAPADKWMRMRKILTPAFNQNILNSFFPVIEQKTIKLVERLSQTVEEGFLDVDAIINQYTLEMICETAMGINIDTHRSSIDFGALSSRVLQIAVYKTSKPWLHYDFIYRYTSLAAEERGILNKIDAFVNNVIRSKKDKHLKETEEKQNGFYVDTEDSHKWKAFLDLLLDLSGNETLTEEQLNEEVTTFILTGSDTTASTLSFALVCLGMHSDIQEKLYQEVIDVIGTHRAIELQDLSNLKYTEMVIKEVLRIFPVISLLIRNINNDIKLGTVTLPAGITVGIPILQLHRSDKYWPDPLKFIPERFTLEEIAKRDPLTWIPFSTGIRNCIGMKYAFMVLKIVLANIVRNFKIKTPFKCIEEIEIDVHFITKSANGFKCSFESR